jgi:hypothetical protein
VKIVVTDFRPTQLPSDDENHKFDVSVEFIVLNTGTEPFIIKGGAIKVNSLCDETDRIDYFSWLQFVGLGFELPAGGIVVNPKDANRIRAKFFPQELKKSQTKETTVCFVVYYLDERQNPTETRMLAGQLGYDQDGHLLAMTQETGLVILESTTFLQKILSLVGLGK